MRVDIEHVKEWAKFRKNVNGVNFSELEFYENGKKLDIAPELLEEFRFMGLSNLSFITDEFYLPSPSE